jgi:transcriptional regulator with XRE-family HTH domain
MRKEQAGEKSAKLIELGTLLRQRRIEKGFKSPRRLVRALDKPLEGLEDEPISEFYIYRIERGKGGIPSKQRLLAWAEVLEIEPDRLLQLADYASLSARTSTNPDTHAPGRPTPVNILYGILHEGGGDVEVYRVDIDSPEADIQKGYLVEVDADHEFQPGKLYLFEDTSVRKLMRKPVDGPAIIGRIRRHWLPVED